METNQTESTTKKSLDGTGTQFSHWLRDCKHLESKQGYTITNVDYIIRNWKTDKWFIVEEKRALYNITLSQYESFKLIHDKAKEDPNYLGFYVFRFEDNSPETGMTYISKLDDYHRVVTVERRTPEGKPTGRFEKIVVYDNPLPLTGEDIVSAWIANLIS